jgi:hypothetical protein
LPYLGRGSPLEHLASGLIRWPMLSHGLSGFLLLICLVVKGGEREKPPLPIPERKRGQHPMNVDCLYGAKVSFRAGLGRNAVRLSLDYRTLVSCMPSRALGFAHACRYVSPWYRHAPRFPNVFSRRKRAAGHKKAPLADCNCLESDQVPVRLLFQQGEIGATTYSFRQSLL